MKLVEINPEERSGQLSRLSLHCCGDLPLSQHPTGPHTVGDAAEVWVGPRGVPLAGLAGGRHRPLPPRPHSLRLHLALHPPRPLPGQQEHSPAGRPQCKLLQTVNNPHRCVPGHNFPRNGENWAELENWKEMRNVPTPARVTWLLT